MKKILTVILALPFTVAWGQNFGTISSGGFSNSEMVCSVGLVVVQLESTSTVSVPEIVKEVYNVKIYPNPSVDHVTIETDLTGTVVLYDFQGRVVSEQKLNSLTVVDVDSQPSGTYILNLITNQGVKSYKIIKQ